MNKATIHSICAAATLFLFSCNPAYKAASVQFKDYQVANAQTDSSFITFLQPYADSVNSSMNTVIAVLAVDIEKKQPEGTLGNLMADAMKTMAEKYYNTRVDAAFVNYGGIRIGNVKAGNITKGKVFELMPFDNIIVLQKVSEKYLKNFLIILPQEAVGLLQD